MTSEHQLIVDDSEIKSKPLWNYFFVLQIEAMIFDNMYYDSQKIYFVGNNTSFGELLPRWNSKTYRFVTAEATG